MGLMGWAKFSLTTLMWSPVEPDKSFELTHLRKQLMDFAWVCSTMDPWETVNMLVPKQHSWWVSISIMGRRCQSDCWFMSRNCRSHIRCFSKSKYQYTRVWISVEHWQFQSLSLSLEYIGISDCPIQNDYNMNRIWIHRDSSFDIIRNHVEMPPLEFESTLDEMEWVESAVKSALGWAGCSPVGVLRR